MRKVCQCRYDLKTSELLFLSLSGCRYFTEMQVLTKTKTFRCFFLHQNTECYFEVADVRRLTQVTQINEIVDDFRNVPLRLPLTMMFPFTELKNERVNFLLSKLLVLLSFTLVDDTKLILMRLSEKFDCTFL